MLALKDLLEEKNGNGKGEKFLPISMDCSHDNEEASIFPLVCLCLGTQVHPVLARQNDGLHKAQSACLRLKQYRCSELIQVLWKSEPLKKALGTFYYHCHQEP